MKMSQQELIKKNGEVTPKYHFRFHNRAAINSKMSPIMIFLIVFLRSRFACQLAATPPMLLKMPWNIFVISSTLPRKKPLTSGKGGNLGKPNSGILNFKFKPENGFQNSGIYTCKFQNIVFFSAFCKPQKGETKLLQLDYFMFL